MTKNITKLHDKSIKRNEKTNIFYILVISVALLIVVGAIIIFFIVNEQKKGKEIEDSAGKITLEESRQRTALWHEEAIAGEIKAKAELYKTEHGEYPERLSDFWNDSNALKNLEYTGYGRYAFSFTYISEVDGEEKTITGTV